jgi:hypothetical protein
MQVRAEQAVPHAHSGNGGGGGAADTGGALPWGFQGPLMELPETGMAELGRLCRAAGAEELFAALMKL